MKRGERGRKSWGLGSMIRARQDPPDASIPRIMHVPSTCDPDLGSGLLCSATIFDPWSGRMCCVIRRCLNKSVGCRFAPPPYLNFPSNPCSFTCLLYSTFLLYFDVGISTFPPKPFFPNSFLCFIVTVSSFFKHGLLMIINFVIIFFCSFFVVEQFCEWSEIRWHLFAIF